MKLFSPKMIMAPIIDAKIHVILSKCNNVIENIQIHMSWQVFFFFFGLKFCINVRKNMIFYHFFFDKKSLDLQKT